MGLYHNLHSHTYHFHMCHTCIFIMLRYVNNGLPEQQPEWRRSSSEPRIQWHVPGNPKIWPSAAWPHLTPTVDSLTRGHSKAGQVACWNWSRRNRNIIIIPTFFSVRLKLLHSTFQYEYLSKLRCKTIKLNCRIRSSVNHRLKSCMVSVSAREVAKRNFFYYVEVPV